MGIKLLHPQEVEVFYILPAVRKEFAKAWKLDGKKQTEIAKLLGVTEAAVSQYLSDKRSDMDLDKVTLSAIKTASKEIRSQSDFIFQTQSILDQMLKTKATCAIHKKVNKEIEHDCTTCFCR